MQCNLTLLFTINIGFFSGIFRVTKLPTVTSLYTDFCRSHLPLEQISSYREDGSIGRLIAELPGGQQQAGGQNCADPRPGRQEPQGPECDSELGVFLWRPKVTSVAKLRIHVSCLPPNPPSCLFQKRGQKASDFPVPQAPDVQGPRGSICSPPQPQALPSPPLRVP